MGETVVTLSLPKEWWPGAVVLVGADAYQKQ